MLVINRAGEQGSIDALEEYHLPVLQDTVEDDVFGLWDASSYDLYIVGRDGRISYADSGAHPVEDYDIYIDVLSAY